MKSVWIVRAVYDLIEHGNDEKVPLMKPSYCFHHHSNDERSLRWAKDFAERHICKLVEEELEKNEQIASQFPPALDAELAEMESSLSDVYYSDAEFTFIVDKAVEKENLFEVVWVENDGEWRGYNAFLRYAVSVSREIMIDSSAEYELLTSE